MNTLSAYLARLLLVRFALLLFGLTLFLLGLDLMVNARSVLAEENGIQPLARYALLRAPTIISDMIKIATLLAGLLTFASLIRHGELVAIWSVGISQLGLFRRLLPVAMLLGGLQYLIDDLTVPVSVETLQQWGVGEDFGDRGNPDDGDDVTWLRIGRDVVRIPSANLGTDTLSDFTIFERGAEGELLARLDVASARYAGNAWELADVTVRASDGAPVRHEARREWRIDLDPEGLSKLWAHPRNLSVGQIRRFAEGAGEGMWAPHLYRTWLYEKLADCFVPLLMLLLSVAMAQQSERVGRVELLLLSGVAIGFAFFIFNGITLAMGEVGMLPPLLAAGVPLAALIAIAGTVISWHELKARQA
jgi:lipopolysaccharide export system permease protein